MGWMNYYKLLDQYDGDLSKATRQEMDWAARCNPNDPPSARAIATEKWLAANGCPEHNMMNKKLGYIAHAEWLEKRVKEGAIQTQCKKCGRYLMPEEF